MRRSPETIGCDMPSGSWQDPEFLREYGLSEDQLLVLPDSAIYALALESPFMRQSFPDTETIEQTITEQTGLTKEAQSKARKKLGASSQSSDKRGFQLVRSDEGISLQLTPAGKNVLAEEINKTLGS
jgi:hypothetical protein